MMRKFYVFILVIAFSYVFFFTFATLIGSYFYRFYLKPELSEERAFIENKLFKEFSNINRKISDLSIQTFQPVVVNTVEGAKQLTTPVRKDHDYLPKYPHFLNCKNNLSPWSPNLTALKENLDYNTPAPNVTHEIRLTRAVLIYFPIDKKEHFGRELRWLYRSWINMQKYEPAKWRTDLVIFVDDADSDFSKPEFFLNELNCKFENTRKSPNDQPMCTLIKYKSLKSRNLAKSKDAPNYDYILDQIDIYSENEKEFEKFYSLLNDNLLEYGYLDSILMAFEGYKYLKSAGYDFLIRSDMDVFLTPFFGHWIPKHCNDFIVGGGGYSSAFNRKRFRRIAQNLRLNYPDVGGLGSTWYSTPDQFRLVAYLTLFGMGYLANEEFAEPERQGKVGTILWPDWHYGVLLLYGQNIALNHLIGSNELNIVKLDQLIDYPTANTESIFKKLHLHVYHGDNLFSKFLFSMGKYDNMTVSESDSNAHEIKYYALRMALESKRVPTGELLNKFKNEILPLKN